MIPATVQGPRPRPRPAARLHRCAAYHRAGVMFTGLTGGTKGPLLPKPRRRISLDVCVPPPHPLPPRVPPSPRTHTDTHGHSRREVSGFGGRVSEGTFNPPANSFPSEDKKIKGRPETLSSPERAGMFSLSAVVFSPPHKNEAMVR